MVDPVVVVTAISALAAAAIAVADGYSHWTVPAIGPWAVGGAAIHVAGRTGAYDGLEAPADAAVLLSVLAAVAALVWLLVGRITAARGVQSSERYLAAAGTGVAITLVAALLVHVALAASRLAVVLAVPLAAAVLGTAGFIAAGFVVADLFTDLRVAGLYTLVTVVFEAVAAEAARELLGGAGPGVVVDVVRTAYGLADVAPTWWAVVAGQFVVGVGVVFASGRLARWRSDAGYAAVLVVSVVTLWSGTAVLLTSAALG